MVQRMLCKEECIRVQKVKKGMDLYGDKNGPSIIMEFDIYRDNYKAVKRRGARIRLITEITRDNIHYCKELMKIVDELKHLDGLNWWNCSK
jgi:two-component system, OmpR family, sensor histidine kinase VicK